jgi:hypothetical protein
VSQHPSEIALPESGLPLPESDMPLPEPGIPRQGDVWTDREDIERGEDK